MFRARPKPSGPPVWIIVGLGNPGGEYKGTRHNVGFEVIDALCEQHKIKLDRAQHRARFGSGSIAGVPVLLVKPLTFMNLSGQSVGPLARINNVNPDHVVVVADDLDLVTGRVRMKPKGSAGGHNGHKSIIQYLKTTDYPRIKIGIGKVNRTETIDHVLGPFEFEEKGQIESAILHSTNTIKVLCEEGLDAAISFANA